MKSFRQAGKTIVLVSHSPGQIRDNCDRALWIHRGRVIRDGSAAAVTAEYHEWSVSGAEEPPAA
jgi:ABC-type polysaccharide/polyol phosphate transport system ATPase subunit